MTKMYGFDPDYRPLWWDRPEVVRHGLALPDGDAR
jgi:hypothetical protein